MVNAVLKMEVVVPDTEIDRFLETLEKENDELRAYVVNDKDIRIARVIIRKGDTDEH